MDRFILSTVSPLLSVGDPELHSCLAIQDDAFFGYE